MLALCAARHRYTGWLGTWNGKGWRRVVGIKRTAFAGRRRRCWRSTSCVLRFRSGWGAGTAPLLRDSALCSCSEGRPPPAGTWRRLRCAAAACTCPHAHRAALPAPFCLVPRLHNAWRLLPACVPPRVRYRAARHRRRHRAARRCGARALRICFTAHLWASLLTRTATRRHGGWRRVGGGTRITSNNRWGGQSFRRGWAEESVGVPAAYSADSGTSVSTLTVSLEGVPAAPVSVAGAAVTAGAIWA